MKNQLILCGILICISFVSAEEYVIKTTWNNQSIDHLNNPVRIELLKNDAESFKIVVKAPLFNSPPGPPQVPNPPGEPLFGLWNLELVKVFFSNDQNQYLEIELGAWGHHWVLLLNGQRQAIRIGMLIDYSVTRQENAWQGTAIIPIDYLPAHVTKMNMFAYHGPEDKRITEALYPAPSDGVLNDHDVARFQPFDPRIIRSEDSDRPSSVWSDAMNRVRSFHITHTWNGTRLPTSETVDLRIRLDETLTNMVVSVDAPFYKDSAPDKEGGGSFPTLYTKEVVHLYFLSFPDLKYLEIELGPWGHYLVAFWNGYYNSVGSLNSPITYVAERNETRWSGKASIPLSYLPPKVYLFNAYSGHGNGSDRKSNSLYPVPADSNRTRPDFHLLQYFKFFDYSILYPDNDSPICSKIWQGMTENCPAHSSAVGMSSGILMNTFGAIVFAFVILVNQRG